MTGRPAVSPHISSASADEMIQRLEVRHDLLSFIVDGWCAWPILRFDASMALTRFSPRTLQASRRSVLLQYALRDFFRLSLLPKSNLLIKTYTSARLDEENDLFIDIYFDDLLRELGSGIKIEGINSTAFLERSQKALIRSRATTAPMEVLAGILTILKIGPRAINNTARQMSVCLKNEPGLDGFTLEWIDRKLRYFYWMKQFYSGLLLRVKPRVVLLADPSEFALVAAAREFGILTVELQHGLVGRDYNSSYSWSDYATGYRHRMAVPEMLFLYGEYWRENLAASGFWGDGLKAVGCPRVDRYLSSRRQNQDGMKTLVLTSQGMDRDNLIEFLADFLQQAQALPGFRLVIKLHPLYDSDSTPYSDALGFYPNVKVLTADEWPSTFGLLAEADLHLSISSACHYDALGLGVPTVILGLGNHEVVLPLYNAGHALFARTPQELVEIVSNAGALKVVPEVSDYYCRKGALENMKMELGLQ